MSARFGFAFEKTGAFSKVFWISTSSAVLFWGNFKKQSLCCSHQQSFPLTFPTVSMRLRPKR